MQRSSTLLRSIAHAAALLALIVLVPSCGGKRPPATPSPSGKKVKATQRPYTVMGKRYEPIDTHVGFAQEGIASWYGKDFHGKKTSNGETYNMYALSAAHKTLPMGVFVKVKNKDTGDEIIVRVNDRGPFVKNRVIDLSFAAAKQLGYADQGTAPVRIEALGYRTKGETGAYYYREPEDYESGNFAVQIGSFKDPQNAQRLAMEMKKLFGYAEIQPAVVDGERFSRVLVGKYTTLKAAEEAETKFAEHGYPGSFAVSLN
jgi:rare lipoprotein A